MSNLVFLCNILRNFLKTIDEGAFLLYNKTTSEGGKCYVGSF